MDKIKNLLSGHKDEENVQATGSATTGTTTGHTGISGEGSHFGTAKDTTATPASHPVESRLPTNTTHQEGVPSGVAGQTAGSGLGQTSGLSGNETTGAGVAHATPTGPHDSKVANKLDPRVDASAGAGGLDTTGTSVGNTQNTGISSANTTTGPHNSKLENKLDPRVDTEAGVERNTHGGITNSGAGFPGTAHSSAHTGTALGSTQNTSTNPSSDHHYGRDAAALGAAGAVGTEAHHDHKNEHSGLAHQSGPHSTGTANTLDPSVNTQGSSKLEDASHHSATHGGGAEKADHHHLGKDAAIGAGGVGLAEHEHHKHEAVSGTASTGPAPNTSGPHKKDWLNKLDPRVNAHETDASTTGHGPLKVDAATAAGPPTTGGHTANPAHHGVENVNPDGSKTSAANPGHGGHHLGRDAAIAGGVGATGYEAKKHHQHTDSGVAGFDTNTSTGKQSEIQADHPGHRLAHARDTHANTHNVDESKDHHYGRDAAVAGGVGVAGYEAEQHHKHNKDLTPEENKERKEHKHEVKEEKKHHHGHHDGAATTDHHYGRDAAIGAGAVGVGEHEHHKHAGHTDKALPTAPGNHGIGTGAGTQNALAGDNQVHSGQLVGDHAHHTHGVPLHEKPVGTDLGDKLHGVERNRGADFATGTADHHYGRDAAVGAGAVGVGEHEHRKHEGLTGHENTSSGLTGSHQPSTTDHHYGRDAAIGAGAVGAGEHEHHKHEGQHHGIHHGEPSSIASDKYGAAPQTGIIGDNQYRQTDTTTGQTVLPGQQETGHGLHHTGGNIGDDRNKLHKEPPLSHPAAQQQGVVGQGQSGVADQNVLGSTNAATNY